MDRLLEENSLDIVESVDDLAREQILQELFPSTPFKKPQSYHATRWNRVNTVLENVDRLTNGRAGLLQRFSSFVIIGGIAAVVNLIVFYFAIYHIPYPAGINIIIPNAIASVLAAEISIMTNFALNDTFTFRHLPGRNRSWWIRCARFQVTSIGGAVLTFIIEFAIHAGLHLPAIFAQAAAIILVLFYNFAVHHLFTYRHVSV